MAFFPQINGNLIITQFPYSYGNAFQTVSADLETGMRWTFPRRTSGLTNFPSSPLWHGILNYSMITDAEVLALRTFFDGVRGRWGRFSFLDPGGNLLQFSESFGNAYWDKSQGIGVGISVADPFRGNLALSLTGTAGDSILKGVVGPTSGGMLGYAMNFSAWVNARSSGQSLFIGFIDDSSVETGQVWHLPQNTWVRIESSIVVPTSGRLRAILGGQNTWTGGRAIWCFGAQCVPTKGSGGYVKSPGNYGYHQNCRFDIDSFAVRSDGPNQNSLQLPVVEVNV